MHNPAFHLFLVALVYHHQALPGRNSAGHGDQPAALGHFQRIGSLMERLVVATRAINEQA
jgi:hypothetical protein